MRRKEKAMESREAMEAVIARAKVCRLALDNIMQHYSGRAQWPYSEAEIKQTAVIQVAVEEMTGKQSV